MRTIFITPILWKRLNRPALRRGEEGQAIVLIAFVAIGMVAMVGLAIDGGLGYLESTRLQRAADAAALAGVIWLPDNRAVGDARAQLAAEANGVEVACYYNTGQADNTAYNQRCRRTSYTKVTQGSPNQFYSFESDVPPGIAIRYRVTLAKMQTRFFLGVLGFPSYPIVRTSTAEYFHRVKFGSSFNYYGSNGVLTDHYMRCDKTNLIDCDGNSNTVLDMRGATYSKYVLMRCEQDNPPSPCIGGFWGHMGGQDILHTNGDAYNPIRDGGGALQSGSGVNGKSITDNGSLSTDCLHTNDPTTWFVNNIFSAPGNNCPPYNNSTIPPIINGDTHPDSPNGQKSFGSEIIVDVDPAAIWSYTDTQANVANHTNLNVTIYDGAENEQGGETFATSDNYQSRGGNYGSTPPYSGWGFQNITTAVGLTNPNSWDTKRLICSPGTTSLSNTGYCDSATLNSPSYPTAPRATSSDADTPGDLATFFPDRNNLELTYNDLRTRLTMYGPPPTPAIPSIYPNVQSYKIGSMEIPDMSVRGGGVQAPIGCPQGGCGGSDYQRFCYFIFDDTKAFWDNTRLHDTQTEAESPPSAGTSNAGPDYAYLSANNPMTTTNRYAYVCPDINPNATPDNTDLRWNQLKGTPTARYGGMTAIKNDRTIQQQILDPTTPNDISGSPIADFTLGMTRTAVIGGRTISNTITITNIDPINTTKNIWDTSVVTTTTAAQFEQVVDPNQDCRRAAVDMSPSAAVKGYPIDSLWGHNRIPFNMAYGDPLVNRAWITDTTWTSTNITNPVAAGKIAGYYTMYYSFHGWRCDWDFDSNYTYDATTGRGNPLKDPTMPPSATNPSLSLQERTLWGPDGQFNKAFVEGHPGLASITYTTHLLKDVDGATAANSKRDFPVDANGNGVTAGFDKDFGLQPYFHMTNVAWDPAGSGNVVVAPNFQANNAPVRAGSYLLHIQTFSGAAANRYAVKAEYENPKTITYTNSVGTLTVTPVPSVYPLTAMTIYANAVNATSSKQDVIFDLAFIPPEYAGTQGIVQLFDSGDVSGSLDVSILAPSTFGPKINTNGAANPTTGTTYNWKVPLGKALTTTLTACPYNLNQCTYNSSVSALITQPLKVGGTAYYNDQWAFLSFQLPSLTDYANFKAACDVNGVPETLCYYFQIDYQLKDPNNRANDTTTWQLLVQGQPVHLVDNNS